MSHRNRFIFKICLLALLMLAFSSAALAQAAPTVTADNYAVNVNGNISVDSASGLLANDTGFNPATHRLEVYDTVSQYGAKVSVAADGSFTYDAPAGFAGTDTFSYTVRNAFGTNSTLVTINVTGETVWFVNASAPAGGDGTFNAPFNSFAPLNGAAGAGDIDSNNHTIFVYAGTYANLEFDLEAGQKLIGHGMGLDLVGTQNDVAAGGTPLLTSASSFPIIEIFGQGGQVRGFNIENTSGWAIRGAPTPNGNFTITDVAIASSVSATGGIEFINSTGTMALTNVSINGALPALSPALQFINTSGTMTLTNVDVGAGSGFTGGYVLNVSGSAGTITFDATSSLTSTNTRGINIGTMTAAGSVTLPMVNIAGGRTSEPLVRLQSNNAASLVNFADGVVSSSTATDSAAFLSDGGRLTIGGTGSTLSASSGPALYLENVELTANATFASLSSTNSNARGISVSNPTGGFDVIVTGTTTISNPAGRFIYIDDTTPSGFLLSTNILTASGAQDGIFVNGAAVTVTSSTSTLTTTAGVGILCQDSTVNAAFATLSAGGSTKGLSFDNCAGTITATAGTLASTAGASNHVVDINTSTINLTYGGSISKSNAGAAVNINGLSTPGAVTFNNTVTATNASGGVSIQNSTRTVTFTTLTLGTTAARYTTTPITLVGNTGAVDLGNVAVYTNGAVALNIAYANASPGQVNSSASSLLDVTGSAVALNVSHATNQPLNLQFASISNPGAGTHGININRASGTLTVSGTVNIGAKTTAGVEIANSTIATDITTLNITGATGDAVRLTNNGAGSTFVIRGDNNFVSVHTNGAGGTWTNIGGSAFNIDGARDIQVTDLTINNVGNYGVHGRGIINLLFSNVDMTNIGNADNEHVFNLREGETSGAPISGNFEVNNSTIENFTDNGVYLENFAGTLNFRWTNNVLRNNITTTACGGGNCNGNGILLRADGTARINAFIQNSTFEQIDGIGITANPEGSSSARMDIAIVSSAFTAAPYAGTGHTNNGETAISLRNAQGNSTLNFRLFSNDIRNYTGELALGVVEVEGGDFTTTNGVIDVLYIYHAHEGNAIQLFADGANTGGGGTTAFTLNVSMNEVNVPATTPIFGASILLQNNGAISGSTINANYIITNSSLLANATASSRRTITANIRDFNNACMDIRNNTVAAGTGGTQPSVNLSYNGLGAVRLQGMIGTGDTNAQTYLNANNTLAVGAVSGPNNNITSATCTIPSLPVGFPFS
jgi:hypothetical protein